MRLRLKAKPLRYLFKPHNYTHAVFTSDLDPPPHLSDPSDAASFDLTPDDFPAHHLPPSIATRSVRSLAHPPERRSSNATPTVMPVASATATTQTTTTTTTTTTSGTPPPPLSPAPPRPSSAAWPGRVVIIDEPSVHALYPRADLGALLQLVGATHAAPVAAAHAVVVEMPVRVSPEMEFLVVGADTGAGGTGAGAAVRFEVISLLMSVAQEAARAAGPRAVALVIPPDPHYALPVLLARRAGCDVELWLVGSSKDGGASGDLRHAGLADDAAGGTEDMGLLFVHCVDRFESLLSGQIGVDTRRGMYEPMSCLAPGFGGNF